MLQPTPGGLVVQRSGAGAHLLLHFATPVLAFSITVDADADAARAAVRSHHHATIVDERPLGTGVNVERAGITDVLLPAAVDRVRAIRFVTERSLVESIERGAGEWLARVDVPADADAAYGLVDFAGGLDNRWATITRAAELRARYPREHVAALVHRARTTLGDPGRTLLAPPGPG